MTILAVVCAALAAVVLLGPPPGVVRLRSIIGGHPGSTTGVRADREASPGGTGPSGARAVGGAAGVGAAAGPWRAGRSADGAGVPATRGVGGSGVGAAAGLWRAGRSAGGAGASSRGRALAAAVASAGAFWLLEGVLGAVTGAGVGIAAWYGLGRLEPAARRRDRERVVAMLPLAADLMAAALAAGCPPAVAAETVGSAIGGPLGRALVDAAAAASVGVEPGRAWSDLAADAAVRPLARALTAATTRGTSPSPVLARVSADARDAARWAGEARARSLGARAAAPLGLCFLPAFVLVGVVPVVATSGILVP
ncbi:type II secretion system F family protein [Jiangella ureilytica]|uniref:Type II secretion system F family protein n=1 Tax=Jiangella ureilytica TaxID=2530374 RepID=A0A4R4R9F0_9ACTN|nr:type II secretion system F family protein [Jiangella ureilytica]TDC45626.1 type II secretion system F family protein [Jiangella ureilytica]